MAKGNGKLTRRQFIGYAAAAGAALAGLRALSRRPRRLRIRDHAASELQRGISIVHGDATAPEDELPPAISSTSAIMKRSDSVNLLILIRDSPWIRKRTVPSGKRSILRMLPEQPMRCRSCGPGLFSSGSFCSNSPY